MHAFEYILIMLGAVLISNPISSRFPRISTPLVQVALGIALTIVPISFEMTLDPELFLVLFIAPLLFEDAKKADKPALWRLKKPILLLALGLVFATVLVVGFCVNWFTPSIPLAAAFALAAALAPTDAVAVASLKESATIREDQDHLLKGESLLNDASGIVSFQFAIAAVLTGSFSLAAATTTFLFMFFGGLAVGIVLMLLRALLVNRLRAAGIENITFHVLFELVTPFLVFLIAESLEVSGIIAVVAAGIVYSFLPRTSTTATPTTARHNIVSTSVWSVITFSLNGLVFLMLGTQLPYVIQRVWDTSAAADWLLILLIIFILFAVMAMRFVWVFVMRRHANLAVGEGTVGAADEVATAGGYVGDASDVGDAEAVYAEGVRDAYSDDAAEAADVVQDANDADANDADANDAVGAGDTGDAEATETTETAGVTEQPHALRIPPTLTDGLRTQDEEEFDRILDEQIDRRREALREQRAALDVRRETRKEERRAERERQRRAAHADKKYWTHHVHDAMVLSLTGAKGAITLAVVLTIPLTLSDGAPFPERDLIIFLASGAILLSLLLANFVVPLVAPRKAEPLQPASEINAILDIYRSVTQHLVESSTPENKPFTELIVQQYYERISKLKVNNTLANEEDAMVRRQIIEWEHERTLELVNEGQVSALVGLIYFDQLSRTLASIEHHNTVRWELKGAFAQIMLRVKRARAIGKERRRRRSEMGAAGETLTLSDGTVASRREITKNRIKMTLELRELTVSNYLYVLERLKGYAQEPGAPTQAIELISVEFERRVERLRNPREMIRKGRAGGFGTGYGTGRAGGGASWAKQGAEYDFAERELEVQARALEYERAAIADALSHGKISRQAAKHLRDNVAMMELDIEEQLE